MIKTISIVWTDDPNRQLHAYGMFLGFITNLPEKHAADPALISIEAELYKLCDPEKAAQFKAEWLHILNQKKPFTQEFIDNYRFKFIHQDRDNTPQP